jgi:serine/threonine protein kinase
VAILRNIEHSNIIKVFGFNNKRGNSYLVTEFLSGGSLYEHIKTQSEKNWPKNINLIKNIIDGMMYLHSKDIVHLDLKTLNILLNEDKNIAKISDFGLSRIATMTSISTREKINNNAKGTIRYMAPEIAKGQNGTYKSDVWSFG